VCVYISLLTFLILSEGTKQHWPLDLLQESSDGSSEEDDDCSSDGNSACEDPLSEFFPSDDEGDEDVVGECSANDILRFDSESGGEQPEAQRGVRRSSRKRKKTNHYRPPQPTKKSKRYRVPVHGSSAGPNPQDYGSNNGLRQDIAWLEQTLQFFETASAASPMPKTRAHKFDAFVPPKYAVATSSLTAKDHKDPIPLSAAQEQNVLHKLRQTRDENPDDLTLSRFPYNEARFDAAKFVHACLSPLVRSRCVEVSTDIHSCISPKYDAKLREMMLSGVDAVEQFWKARSSESHFPLWQKFTLQSSKENDLEWVMTCAASKAVQSIQLVSI